MNDKFDGIRWNSMEFDGIRWNSYSEKEYTQDKKYQEFHRIEKMIGSKKGSTYL